MALQFRGRYFDGKSALRREARVMLTAQGVEITDDEGKRLWPYDKLQRPEPLPGGGVRFGCEQAPDAQLVIEAPEAYEALRRFAPRFHGGAARWRRHRREILMVVVLVLVIVVGGFYGIPQLAKPLAIAMPQSWTEKLGSVVEQDIVGGARDCDAEAGVQVLDRLVGRLTAGMDPVPDLKVRVVDRKMVNAFAAPGGRVVIMGGLIGKAEKAEEVAGVLAHEVGHVLERHPTINAIRVFGLMTLIDLVMGDSSTVLETLGQAGGLLLLTAYSREDERAADEHALSILAAAGIDAGGLARFFDRLAKKDKDVPEFLSYIASHPKLADRRALAEAASGQGRSPALNDADWKALKEICGVKK